MLFQSTALILLLVLPTSIVLSQNCPRDYVPDTGKNFTVYSGIKIFFNKIQLFHLPATEAYALVATSASIRLVASAPVHLAHIQMDVGIFLQISIFKTNFLLPGCGPTKGCQQGTRCTNTHCCKKN
jgi:hypothetical protein